MNKIYEDIKKKLLAIDGKRVQYINSDRIFANVMATHFNEFIQCNENKLPVRYVKIRPHKCHENAATFLLHHPSCVAYIGYALIDEDWVEHSWCVCGGHLIELTSGNAKRYVGIPRPKNLIENKINVGYEEVKE